MTLNKSFCLPFHNFFLLFFFKSSVDVIGMIDLYWTPEMECLQNINFTNIPISELAKEANFCRVDKKSTWVPLIRHSNAAYDPNYFMK